MENKSARIYFLPTLMTGGNLICGFAATLSILHGTALQGNFSDRAFFGWAVIFIMGACIFDCLDGLIARLSRQESAFGREFDSHADLVSFGLAPALLVYRIVLKDFPLAGWLLAAIYLLCCALRLARFNCTAASIVRADTGKPFDGLPVPGAAGLIASSTWFLLSLTPDRHQVSGLSWLLPPLMLFLSFMMLSHISYPSIRAFHLRTGRFTLKLVSIFVALSAAAVDYRSMPAALCFGYLLYSFLPLRFLISRRKEVTQKRAATISREALRKTGGSSMVGE